MSGGESSRGNRDGVGGEGKKWIWWKYIVCVCEILKLKRNMLITTPENQTNKKHCLVELIVIKTNFRVFLVIHWELSTRRTIVKNLNIRTL